jgi:hypothetical protein
MSRNFPDLLDLTIPNADISKSLYYFSNERETKKPRVKMGKR